MEEKNDNWFGSWLNAAKSKSSEVLEFVKKDLEEFGTAVKNEASNVVNTTGSVIGKTLRLDEPESTANTMKRSISSLIGQMNEALNPSPDDSDTEAIMIIEDSETVTLTKLQQALYNLQKDDNTFLKDPEPSLAKQYNCWLEIVDDELWSSDRYLKHLLSSVTLNNQYTKHVPTNVSHTLFWKRYLFKKALLEDDLANEKSLLHPVIKEEQITEENLKWEQEDFANDIELTEEEQIRLLEEYEEEKNQKKEKSPKPSKALVGEDVIFRKPGNKTINNKNLPEGNGNQDTLCDKKVSTNMNKSNSSISIGTSGSNSSTDDDWEKINDTEK